MRYVYLLAVDLGAKFASHPLAGIYAELRSLNVFAIGLPSGIVFAASFHPIIASVVRNLQDVIEQTVGLNFPRVCVLVPERIDSGQPPHYGRLARHILIKAYRPQAFTLCKTLAYCAAYLCGEARWPSH